MKVFLSWLFVFALLFMGLPVQAGNSITVKDVIQNKRNLQNDIKTRIGNLAAHIAVHHSDIQGKGQLPWVPGVLRINNVDDFLGIDPYKDGVPYKRGDETGFRFSYNDWAYIEVYNIRPKAGADTVITYSDPDLLDRHTRVASTVEWRNESPRAVPWTPQFGSRVEQEDTQGKQLGTTISAGLEQTISYGSEAAQAKGETKLTFNVSQSINLSEQKRQLFRTDIDSVTDLTVDPYTVAYVDQMVDQGTMRQHVTAKGPLDFSIRLESHGDYFVHWDSVDDMIQAMTGVAAETGYWKTGAFYDGNWADWYRSHPVVPQSWSGDLDADTWEIINQFASPLAATLETDIEFDGAFRYFYRYRTEDLPIPDGEAEAE